jgi:hypothetical protein
MTFAVNCTHVSCNLFSLLSVSIILFDSCHLDCVDYLQNMPKDKKRPYQKFISAYTEQWPVIKRSRQGESFASCTVCHSDFPISHGGHGDCVPKA